MRTLAFFGGAVVLCTIGKMASGFLDFQNERVIQGANVPIVVWALLSGVALVAAIHTYHRLTGGKEQPPEKAAETTHASEQQVESPHEH